MSTLRSVLVGLFIGVAILFGVPGFAHSAIAWDLTAEFVLGVCLLSLGCRGGLSVRIGLTVLAAATGCILLGAGRGWPGLLPLLGVVLLWTNTKKELAAWGAGSLFALSLSMATTTLLKPQAHSSLSDIFIGNDMFRHVSLSQTPIGTLRVLWGSVPEHWGALYDGRPPYGNHWKITGLDTYVPALPPNQPALSLSAAEAEAHKQLLPQTSMGNKTWAAYVTGALTYAEPSSAILTIPVYGGLLVAGQATARMFSNPPWVDNGPQGSESTQGGAMSTVASRQSAPATDASSSHLLTTPCLGAFCLKLRSGSDSGKYQSPQTTTFSIVESALWWAHSHLRWSQTVSPPPSPKETPAQFFARWQGQGSCAWIASRVAYMINGNSLPGYGPANMSLGWWVQHPGVVTAEEAHAWLNVDVGGIYHLVDPTAWVKTASSRHYAAFTPNIWLIVPSTIVILGIGIVLASSPRRRLRRLEQRLARLCRDAGLTPGRGACETARLLGDEEARARAATLSAKCWKPEARG